MIICAPGRCDPYGSIHPGRRMTLKKLSYFFYGENYIPLNICIDGLQPACMYQLRVKRGPHGFSLGLAPIELV